MTNRTLNLNLDYLSKCLSTFNIFKCDRSLKRPVNKLIPTKLHILQLGAEVSEKTCKIKHSPRAISKLEEEVWKTCKINHYLSYILTFIG